MITKDFIISELSYVANVLAHSIIAVNPSVVWGGKDEANGGQPGKITKMVVTVLEKLPVTWDRDKAEFKLSGTHIDDKGIGGVKTWSRATLPGKYEDIPFELQIYRDGTITKYSFHKETKTDGKVEIEKSKVVSSFNKITETFNHFFGLEKLHFSELFDKVNDYIYLKRSSLYGDIKEHLKDVVSSPIISTHKDSQKHNICIRFFAPEENLKNKDKTEMSSEALSAVNRDITKFISEMEGIDMSRVRIKTNFKAVSKEDGKRKGFVLTTTLKF